jgi:CheY-like chemotaxis protein
MSDIAGGPGRSVLVVDDDASVRRVIRRCLQTAYTVFEASSAGEARLATDERTPDLIIMDLVLPGMEGREAANMLLARWPGLPVLYVSGYSSMESARVGPIAEGHAFLRKPFKVRELTEAVAALMSLPVANAC